MAPARGTICLCSRPWPAAVRIPVIASGGAGQLAHLAEALEAGAHGVLAATIFHFKDSSLPRARAYLRERGYPVRPMILAVFRYLRSRCRFPPAAPCLRPTRAGTQVQGEVRVCPGRYRIPDRTERGVIIAAASGTRIDLTGVVLESGDSVPGRYVGVGIVSRGVDGVTISGGDHPGVSLRGAARGRPRPPGHRHRSLRQPEPGSAPPRPDPIRPTAWT